ncbi:MAG: tetratricopeptide repeat protein [Bacteroidales bacterium]|nr:tetratricopeptide repeat protein [Bacteroidales bacterium]
MKKIFFYFLVPILLFGCATNDLTIGVTEPAPITIPGNVKKVGVVNRTKTNSSIPKEIDEILTLEMLTIDSTAALKAINGLSDELQKNERFTEVKNLHPMLLENQKRDWFSANLTKNEVVKVCSDNNLDAIFVLEYFDTDTRVDYKAIPVKKMVLGVEVDVVETEATVNTAIKLGWRIYDANGVNLYDEFPLSRGVVSNGRGINPLKAISAVVGQKDLVENTSYTMGKNYALDLLPVYHRVSRIYYVKGTDNFKIGKRLARAGKWDDAASYWEKEVNNPKAKIAGRAYFNMAIINEINGDIDAAMDWAEKSYTLFNNKKALRYLNVLKARKIRMQELERQLN